MKVTFESGTEINGQQFRISEFDATGRMRNVLNDCGSNPSVRIPFVEKMRADGLENLDAIMVSHSHEDHGGKIAIASFRNPETPVYMDPVTRLLLLNDLRNNRRDLSRDSDAAVELNYLTIGMSQLIPKRNLRFIENDVMELFPGFTAEPFDAHHIPGAKSLLYRANSKNLYVTNDIGAFQTPTVKGYSADDLPKVPIDVLLMDSTHDQDIPERLGEEERLCADVLAALSQGRTVYIPVLLKVRLPDVVIRLAQLGVKQIYVAGMGGQTIELMLLNTDEYNNGTPIDYWIEEPSADNDGYKTFHIGEGTIKVIESRDQKEELLSPYKTGQGEPKVLAMGSGMLTGGSSVAYGKELIPNESILTCLCNYMAPDTPGYQLQTLPRGESFTLNEEVRRRGYVKTFAHRVKINCEVKTYELTGHVGRSQVLDIVRHLNPKQTFLVHGDTKCRENLKTFLSENGFPNVFVPKDGDSVEF